MTILHMHVSVIPTRGYSFKIKPAFSDSMRQVGGKKHQEIEKMYRENERGRESKWEKENVEGHKRVSQLTLMLE